MRGAQRCQWFTHSYHVFVINEATGAGFVEFSASVIDYFQPLVMTGS